MGEKKKVFERAENHGVIFDYEPRQFPMLISDSASGFVAGQRAEGTDFKVNELIADQAGIAELRRKDIEADIEEQALQRLKLIEEKAYKEAYDLGVIEGTEKAFQQFSEEFVRRVDALDELLKVIDNIKLRLVAENERELLRIVNTIASKIAFKEIEGDQELVLQVLGRVVEDAQTIENVVIKLSNLDSMFIESLREKLDKRVDFLKRIKIEGVDDVESGGCILETDYGVIDASLEARTKKVWDSLRTRTPRVTPPVDVKESSDDNSDNSDDNSDEES